MSQKTLGVMNLLEVTDPSRLTDDDWAEINKLRKAYQEGGKQALCKAYSELGKSPVRYVRVMSAFYPREVTESIRDAMAKRGLTVEDILEMIRIRADPAGD